MPLYCIDYGVGGVGGFGGSIAPVVVVLELPVEIVSLKIVSRGCKLLSLAITLLGCISISSAVHEVKKEVKKIVTATARHSL